MSAPTCPVCGRPVYRIDRSYPIGRPGGIVIADVDRTLRHNDDGSVSTMPDGTVVCEADAHAATCGHTNTDFNDRYFNQPCKLPVGHDYGHWYAPLVKSAAAATDEEGGRMSVRLHVLNLVGGGGELACTDCLPDAVVEHGESVVSLGPVDSPGESCGWCGETQSAEGVAS